MVNLESYTQCTYNLHAIWLDLFNCFNISLHCCFSCIHVYNRVQWCEELHCSEPPPPNQLGLHKSLQSEACMELLHTNTTKNTNINTNTNANANTKIQKLQLHHALSLNCTTPYKLYRTTTMIMCHQWIQNFFLHTLLDERLADISSANIQVPPPWLTLG